MNIETLKQQLQSEGFPFVYAWKDASGTVYADHAHKGRVVFYVIKGSLEFSGGIERMVSAGDRIDVPVGVSHSAVIGPEGCEYIVGQDIEDDA